MNAWLIALVALATVGAVFLLVRLVMASRLYLKFRGERLVVCPENKHTAAVAVAAGPLAAKAVVGKSKLRLQECSRWPEREDCGQECLSQIEENPGGCLVWNVANAWYYGKNCVSCGKPFGQIDWHDHRPALSDAKGNTVQWTDVPPETLPDVFATHWPVCWDCHIAESFRREHPEMVTDRMKH